MFLCGPPVIFVLFDLRFEQFLACSRIQQFPIIFLLSLPINLYISINIGPMKSLNLVFLGHFRPAHKSQPLFETIDFRSEWVLFFKNLLLFSQLLVLGDEPLLIEPIMGWNIEAILPQFFHNSLWDWWDLRFERAIFHFLKVLKFSGLHFSHIDLLPFL